MDATSRPRRFALLGPGRAGTSIGLALVARGWAATAVAGRSPESTGRLADRLGAVVRAPTEAGRDASVVVIATPDAAIRTTAVAVAPSLAAGALVVHLSGASTLTELDDLVLARPDVKAGSLHPLQSLPSGDVGRARLAGSWCAVAGHQDVERLATSLGMRPFRVDEKDRAAYHAAASVASNHLVALLGQVQRLAAGVRVPFEAFLPLVRSTIDNVAALGPAAALTGPVARGDAETVERHLDSIAGVEHDAYRALARSALRLAARDDRDMEDVLA